MKLKALREEKEYTQEFLAYILKCKQNTYQQYESEKRQIPIEALKKLCIFYNVSADYILELPRNLPYPKR